MLHLSMISSTELQAYRVCRRRWLYDKEQEILPKSIPTALWFGSAGHRALERYHSNNRTLEDLMAGLRQGVDEQIVDLTDQQGFCREAVMADIDAHYGEVADLLMLYEQFDQQTTQPAWTVMETERRFHIEIAPDVPPLTGQLDLLVRRDGALTIVDHKFYSRVPDRRTLHLDTQITAYCYIVWKACGELPRQAILNVLVKKKPSITVRAPKLGTPPWQGRCVRLETSRSLEAVQAFEQRAIVQMREMVQTAQEPERAYPNPAWQCPSCSYYHCCLETISGASGDAGSMPWDEV
jgi:hypothetical protein